MKITKRDGTLAAFDRNKIKNAVLKALTAVDMPSESVATKVTSDVMDMLKSHDAISVEAVQDMVEMALMKRGLTAAAKAYILYRDEHARARRSLHVRGRAKKTQSVTDQSMLIVQSMSTSTLSTWDRKRIEDQLISALEMSEDAARSVAKEVEDRVIAMGLDTISSALIRELVNSVLMSKGISGQLRDLTMYGVPKDFIEGLMHDKVNENSNITTNNTEAVNLGIAELVLKQYALDSVFDHTVRDAHNKGRVYVHDMGYPHRVYCSSHSLEYLKKYGLQGIINLNTTSKPAKTASVLTGHLNTFLASMQSNYAGALGIAYVNIMYAPFLVGMNDTQMYQVAQELIFNGSQNAFSRGGQTLFIDLNIHTGVPQYLRNVPAVGPGGKYMARLADGTTATLEEQTLNGDWCLVLVEDGNGRVLLREHDGKQEFQECSDAKVITYGDYDQESMQFAKALLKVWRDGDAQGRVFEFPKCDFHVSSDTFEGEEQLDVFRTACDVAAHNGSVYFVFDRDAVSLAACCRLRIQITDMSLLQHPEHLRTCGFQNVTINIPQAAYRTCRAGDKSIDGLLKEIDEAMDIAVQAHQQKRKFIEGLMKGPGDPLWQIGKTACDGRPYVNLDDATYIIGIIGVNDAVQFLTGKQMHSSDEALDMALQITAHMYLRCKEYTKQLGLQFKLEESPAESAARKLAKSDLVFFREEALQVYKGGDEDHAYYTNSIHLSADAPVDLWDRIAQQAKFNSVIEAGAITHAFVGEHIPSSEAIAKLVRLAFLRTQSAQIVFSPEFTYCNSCGANSGGIHTKCPSCGSEDVVGETRIVGYFSRVSGWNLSKLAELKARQRGTYYTMEG